MMIFKYKLEQSLSMEMKLMEYWGLETMFQNPKPFKLYFVSSLHDKMMSSVELNFKDLRNI